MAQNAHIPVLLDEITEALAPTCAASGARVIDATFGRGGHAARLLDSMAPDGILLGIDRDPAAIETGEALAALDTRFRFCAAPFSRLADCVAAHCGEGAMADAVLMDLGVSSPQIDSPERGFSFQSDGPLDMRMDTRSGETVAEFLASASEAGIAQVLFELGEEREARRIARAVVNDRGAEPFVGTAQLAALVARVVRRRTPGRHPATRTFQALRMFVNRELDELREGLDAAVRVLGPGGRLAVISFHSLEDRIVKQRMRPAPVSAATRRLARRVPIAQDDSRHDLRPIGRAIRPGEQELARNPRARSATLRVAERVA